MAHFNEKYDSFEIHTGETLIKIHTERAIDQMKTTFLQQKIYFNNYAFYNCMHSKNRFYIFCDFLVNLGPSFDINF
jgi:hypothetical protein